MTLEYIQSLDYLITLAMAKSRPHRPTMNCVSIAYICLLFCSYTSSVVKINDALLRKIEIQLCFFCCGDLDHLSTGANSSYSIRMPRDVFNVIDGALTAHTF